MKRMLIKAKEELGVKQNFWKRDMSDSQAKILNDKVVYLEQKLDEGLRILSQNLDKEVLYADLLATETSITNMPRQGWSPLVTLPVRVLESKAKDWYATFMEKIKNQWRKVKELDVDNLDSLLEGTDKLVAEFKQRLSIAAAPKPSPSRPM